MRPGSLRKHWVNCCADADAETAEIDELEDALGSAVRERAQPIRHLITRFEICHWNAERWLERILQAIAEERVPPTSGRPRTQHPLVRMHLCLREALAHWAAQSADQAVQCTILDRTSVDVLCSLGEWTPLKAWVVQRIHDGLEHHLCTNGLMEPPEGVLTLFHAGGPTLEDPEAEAHFAESLDLLVEARSREVKVRSGLGAEVKEHSLALLCGWLNPCSERYFPFLFGLFEVLATPDEERVLPSPFCGSISRERHRRTYQVIGALQSYCGRPGKGPLETDSTVLAQLGEPTPLKRWLAASLEKTLREQAPGSSQA